MKTVLKSMSLAIALFAFVSVNAQNGNGTTVNNAQISFPVSIDMVNPCNNEAVTLTGTLHVVNQFRIGKNGVLHLKSNSNLQGVSGVGSLGNNYNLNDNSSFKWTLAPGQSVRVDQHVANLTGGNAGNSKMNYKTITTSGFDPVTGPFFDVEVIFDKTSLNCK